MRDELENRKSQEAALRESQQIIVAILNAVPARIFWKDKNLVYLGCNAPFARDAGFASPEDLIGKDDYQMGWRDQAELYRAADRQVIEMASASFSSTNLRQRPTGKPSRSSRARCLCAIQTGKSSAFSERI